MKLNSGDALGLRDNFFCDQDLINKLYLDQNSLDAEQLSHIIEGITQQKRIEVLMISGNAVNETSIQHIGTLLKNRVPDQLQELHFIHAKVVWRATEMLLKQLRQKNCIRKLSLVDAGINDYSMKNLCEFIRL